MVEVPYKRKKDRKKAKREDKLARAQLDEWEASSNQPDISPEMIVALKELLRGDLTTQTNVVVAQVKDIVVDRRLEILNDEDECDAEEIELLQNPKVVELIRLAAYHGSEWGRGLTKGLAMSGAEWPKHHSNPDWVAGALARNELQKRNASIIEGNPELDWTEHQRLMDIVYGGVRALMDRHWDMPEEEGRNG